VQQRKLGFLGPPGSNGEDAALRYDPNAQGIPFETHSAIVEAVIRNAVEVGVIAIENSIEGPVSESIDAMLKHEAIQVCGEIVLAIEHFLIAAPGTQLKDIEVITSHPQALAQCRQWLDELQQEQPLRFEAAFSTAGAVELAVKTPKHAGIGTRRAAEIYGGHIIATRLQDVSDNQTRFVVVGHDDAAQTGDDKTSIAFTTAHDQPGTLVSVLGELSNRSINMTRVESRPSRQGLGVYVFLVDVQGHRDDVVIAEALTAVEERSDFFRVLGSYPRFVL
jgi:prephenate dehydratase